jgi:hypothetical protein
MDGVVGVVGVVAVMTEEQRRIVECWERHEHKESDIGPKRLLELVSAETGADDDTIFGALMAGLGAKGDAQ